MAVRYRSGRWVVEFEQAGVRVYRRLPLGATESQGKALEAKLRREIFDRETLEKIPALTLQDAIEQWLREDHRRKDKRKAQSEARQWVEHAKGRLLREAPAVAQEATTAWTTHTQISPAANSASRTSPVSRQADALSSATINRRLAMLKAVCRHAYKRELIAHNLSNRITMLREDNRREVYLTKKEVMSLAGCAPSAASKAAIILLAYSGLRVSEFLAQTEHTLRSGTFVVQSSVNKSGKPRRVAVAQPARKWLRVWWAQPSRPDYWRLHKEFLVARKAAKVGPADLRIHDLRHTFASWLAEQGHDLYTIAELLGDELQSAARYTHLIDSNLKKAIAGLR